LGVQAAGLGELRGELCGSDGGGCECCVGGAELPVELGVLGGFE
jgi:hypothetical protein